MRMSRDPRSAAPIWSGRKLRSLALQTALIAAIALVLGAAAHNAFVNMRAHGIPTNLAFWSNIAGFNIDQTLIPFDAATSTYGDAFWVGLLNTLLVAAISVVLATVLGFALGFARLSNNLLVANLATVYVESIRNVPLLLQLLFWYNAVLKPLPGPRQSLSLFHSIFLNDRGLVLPSPILQPGAVWVATAFLIGVALALAVLAKARRVQAQTGAQFPGLAVAGALLLGLPLIAYFAAGRPIAFAAPVLRGFNFVGGIRILPELAALALGLSTYTAAFIAEAVRGGLLAVDRGQLEAARALGLSGSMTLRLVVLPQAMRAVIPPLTNQYLNLIKNSSLAVFIGYPDLTEVFAGTVLNQTGAAIQVIAITMAVYLAISLATSFGMGLFNRRMASVER
jgi:general L-amino acid transport system permease protein